MAKGNFWNDTTEQLVEFGVSTAKNTAQGVVKSLNPLQSLTETTNTGVSQGKDPGMEKMKLDLEKPNNTPIDFGKLQNKYADQDKMKINAMRNKLFNMVKNDELKAIAEIKEEEEERKQKQKYEEQLSKRMAAESQQNTGADLPQGKVRQTIGAAHKKKAMESHAEVKANKSSG